jgi:hypothetical protein
MAFVITEPCMDVMDQACIHVCPVVAGTNDLRQPCALLIRNAANLTWFVVYPRIYSVDAKLCTLAVSGRRGDRVSGSVNVERVGQRAHKRPVSARRL